MLPALRALAQASPQTTVEVRRALAAEFSLSEEALAELLPSGRQTTFANRVAWAYSYLKQAGLIASPKRGVYEITGRGRGVLAEQPTRIDTGFLTRFPEFQAFRKPAPESDGAVPTPLPAAAQDLTPDEQIRAGYTGVNPVRWLSRTLCDQAAHRTRLRSSSKPARPYIWRLSIFRRLICPSAWPLLHGSTSAARTAA